MLKITTIKRILSSIIQPRAINKQPTSIPTYNKPQTKTLNKFTYHTFTHSAPTTTNYSPGTHNKPAAK